MFKLTTSRLLLLNTPLAVMERRLTEEHFAAEIDTGDGVRSVTFPPEWPGDALDIFPMTIDWRLANPNIANPNIANSDVTEWGGMIIERASDLAVGQMGTKGMPDADGTVEIGYGINPSSRNHGIATEAAQAFVAWLLDQPSVRRVTAECGVDNVGSRRVLEKVGFERTGERIDEEDGPLILWGIERRLSESGG